MRLRGNPWSLVVIALVIGGASHAFGSTTSTPEQDLRRISTALGRSEIGRIEILQIPGEVLTRARISPEMLERQYHFKLVVRDVIGSARRDKLVEVFESLSVEARNETADLRWGIIFYLRNNDRAGALYFDRAGRYGAVNGKAVSYRGEFFSWMRGAFSACFQ